jgi:hypothetical protein
LQNSQFVAERFRYLLGNKLKYSTVPPDWNIWGASTNDDCDDCDSGEDDAVDCELNLETSEGERYINDPGINIPGWWRAFLRKPKAAIGATIEALFYPEHDRDGALGSPGKWYSGKIVSNNMTDASWDVIFEDGDEMSYPKRDFKYNLDVRVLSSPEFKIVFVGADLGEEEPCKSMWAGSWRPGPWEIWLNTNLSDMLLSIFRSVRRNVQVNETHLLEILACQHMSGEDPVFSSLTMTTTPVQSLSTSETPTGSQ